MAQFKQSIQVCKIFLLKESKKIKNYCIIVIAAVAIGMYMEPTIEYSKMVGYKLALWIFPFIMATRELRLVVYTCFVFLITSSMSDNNIFYEICIRTKVSTYRVGKILCITILSMIYTFFIATIGVCMYIPYFRYEKGWGKVLYSITEYAIEGNVMNTLVGRRKILQELTPVSGMLLEGLAVFLTCFLIGLVLYYFSQIIQCRQIGILICSILIMLDFASEGPLFEYTLLLMSPLSWSNLNLVKIKKYMNTPSVWLCFILGFFTKA